MIISERIFRIMEEKGVTQIEFSKKTGISQSTISDWKRKKTNPSADKILVICKTLGVTPYEILQDTVGEDTPDYLFASKGTDKYDLLMEYDSLDNRCKERLKGYIVAMKDL